MKKYGYFLLGVFVLLGCATRIYVTRQWQFPFGFVEISDESKGKRQSRHEVGEENITIRIWEKDYENDHPSLFRAQYKMTAGDIQKEVKWSRKETVEVSIFDVRYPIKYENGTIVQFGLEEIMKIEALKIILRLNKENGSYFIDSECRPSISFVERYDENLKEYIPVNEC